ncbi:glycosyltransferase family 39 protein [Candidatus Micrarchaeota archaeon]|nr:glycosyltransferase family 39 protein [Candidatus Micrarchaeota archaeon]
MEKRLFHLIILAFIIRIIPLLAIAFLGTNNALYDGDSGSYTVMAKSFAKGDILFKEEEARLSSFSRTPGYPIFLGIFYFLSLSDTFIAFIQIIIDCAALYFIYKTVDTVFGNKAAFFASLLYALNPTMILFSFKILTESLFNFVFITANYYFVRSLYKNEKSELTVGILFSILSLIRPVGIFFSLTYALVLFAKNRNLKSAFLLFIPSLILPALWMIRNQQVLGYFIISAIPEVNVLCWQATFLANDNVDMEKWGKFIDEYKVKDYTECNRLPYEKVHEGAPIATKFILDNFGLYIKYFVKAVILFFAPATPNYVLSAFGVEGQVVHFSEVLFKIGLDFGKIVSIIAERPLYLALFALSVIYELILYYLFASALLKLIKEKKHNYLLLLLALLFLYTIISAGLVSMFSSYRYRMPIEIFLIIIASYYKFTKN